MSDNLPEKKTETSIQNALLGIVQRTDIDPERLEKFLDLQIMMEERQSKEAYNKAMAAFQGDCPVIVKNKTVDFTAKSGNQTKYDFAPLDEIVSVIKPLLQKHGLSFSFNIVPGESMDCLITTISHADGHSKDYNYTFFPMHDDQRMNQSQRRKSAITYAKRAGLENALGIVTTGEDDDANRALDTPVNENQIAEIRDLMEKTKTKEDSFLKYLGVAKFEELSFTGGKKAIYALRTKRDSNVS
jgi:hypothetical protein